MPKVIYDIPGIKDSVQRPVVFDIVRQIMEWTGSPKMTNILFGGETEKVYQPGSTISGEAEYNSFNSDAQWTITVGEETQIDRILSTAVDYDDNPHIFYDGDTAVYLRPTYTPVDVTLNISARFTDKERASRWRDDIRNRISTLRAERIHSVSYSYLIPPECLYILAEIHRMREKVAPYGQTFEQYYTGHVTKKATVLSDLAGQNTAKAIAETQAEVLGWFDFEGEPVKGEKDGEIAAWDINFTYKFKYDRPSTCHMEYPLMVHNQLMSTKFRDTGPPPTGDDVQRNYSISSRCFAAFRTTRLAAKNGLPGVSLPSFDEFLPSQVMPDTMRLITCLTSIDPVNPRDILSLTDFDDYKLTPEILDFLETEYPYLNQDECSIFCVSVYHGLIMMKPNRFEITPELMVRLNDIPSLRSTFHVRFAVHKNPKYISARARERLRNNYAVAKQVFWSLFPRLQQMNLPGPSLPGNLMSHKDFAKCIDIIDNEYSNVKNGDAYQFNTVMTLLVEANRRT